MLKNLLSKNIIIQIAKIAKSLDIETYAVGGCVRDALLGRESKDIDIACVGDCLSLAHNFAKVNNKDIHEFKNFGTVMVKMPDGDVEFVAARKESYNINSRKPIVKKGTLLDDLSRRDFTINAMAVSLNESSFGTLIDLFDGLEDIKNKILRTPLAPDITFSDDPLRMMRAIRFSSQLHFKIFQDTLEAIKKTAERLKIISQERITTELNKIILSNIPSRGFYLLEETNLLKQFFPELLLLKGCETIEGFSHKENFIHTLQVLDNIAKKSDNLWLRWAAILHDIAKPKTKKFNRKNGFTFHGHEFFGAKMVPEIFKRLKLPTSHPMQYVKKLVRMHLRPIVLAQDCVTDSAVRRLVYDMGEDIDDLILLCRADITSNNPEKVKKYLNNFDIIEKKIIEVENKDRLKNFQPIITGDVIMKTFNLKPCASIGKIKNEIKDAIIDGLIPNIYDDAYKFMINVGKKYGYDAKIFTENSP